jgi:hypothetical protein
MNKQWIDTRQTPEAKAILLALTIDQMKKGWTDRGIKRSVADSGLYKKDDIPRFIDSPKNRLPWGDFGIRYGA